MATDSKNPAQALSEFAPKFSELTSEVLFGDVWERPGLSKRDRSLITVAALVALYRVNELFLYRLAMRRNGTELGQIGI